MYAPVSAPVQVHLAVEEDRARTASLVSGASAPGAYPIPDNDYTILDLIAEGGGVSVAIKNPQVRLQRASGIYGISLGHLLDMPSHNTTLQGGDMVYIEEDDRQFLLLGVTGSEAAHSFPTDRVTAAHALAIIGGVSDTRADATGILILRRYPVAQVTADRSGRIIRAPFSPLT